MRKALKLAQRALSNKNASAENIYSALHAIKKALAQPEQEPVETLSEHYLLSELKSALTQPEQEPVAWIDRICLKNVSDGFEPTISKNPVSKYDVPLYTTPPKRDWVGLTDDERDKIILGRQQRWEIAHMIEAKLKEQNT